LGWPQALVVEVLQMFIAGVDLSVLLGAEGAGTTEIGGVI
jgi:hypothetical protein